MRLKKYNGIGRAAPLSTSSPAPRLHAHYPSPQAPTAASSRPALPTTRSRTMPRLMSMLKR
jgi:hypothetical protein